MDKFNLGIHIGGLLLYVVWKILCLRRSGLFTLLMAKISLPLFEGELYNFHYTIVISLCERSTNKNLIKIVSLYIPEGSLECTDEMTVAGFAPAGAVFLLSAVSAEIDGPGF